MAKYAVALTSDIPEGERKLFTIGGRPIVVFNVKGDYFALLNKCPHQGASLCHGHITGFVSSTTPGEYIFDRAARSSAAHGTAGNSTCATGSHGSILCTPR
ncbi:MAG: Rieske (2Fe-2S) protein [Acetobacteraceae bacterium]